MKKAKYSILRLLFCIIICLITDTSVAGPPFLADDPEPVDFHHWEIYLFSSLDKNQIAAEEPDLQAPAFEADWGALPNLQLHLVVPYVWSLPPAAPANNGIGDIEAGVKYRFIQETNILPQIGIFPLVELPAGDANRKLGNGKAWYKLPLWLQKSWGRWKAYGGGGYAINPAKNTRNYPYAGCLLQKDLNEHLTLSAEVFSQGAVSTQSRSFTIVNAGGYYHFTKQMSLLFSAGHSVLGEQHTVGYLGLYWTG